MSLRRTSLGMLATAVVTGFVSCSLDLDESLLEGSQAGAAGTLGASGGRAGDTATGGRPSSSGGSPGAGGSSQECTNASDCPVPNGCVTPSCNNNRCTFSVCPEQDACTARACDAEAGACAEPAELDFLAGQIDLEDGIGCGGNARSCLAALGDHVFIAGPDANLLAYEVHAPTSPARIEVKLPGEFIAGVARLVPHQDRVLVLGNPVGGRLPVAWISAPSTPYTSPLIVPGGSIKAEASVWGVWAATESRFFLTSYDELASHPTGLIEVPVTAERLTQHPNAGLAGDARIIGGSGSRLVAARMVLGGEAQRAAFTLVPDGGTDKAQAAPESVLSDIEASMALGGNGVHSFASSPGGALVWMTNHLVRNSESALVANGVVLRWLLTSSKDAEFDGARSVELAAFGEDYSINTARSGPMVFLDETSVLVTHATPADPEQTRIGVVTRDDQTLEDGKVSFIVPFEPARLAAAAGRRFAFVYTPELPSSSRPMRILIFAPDC